MWRELRDGERPLCVRLNISSVPLLTPAQSAGVRLSNTLILISNVSTCGNQLDAETKATWQHIKNVRAFFEHKC